MRHVLIVSSSSKLPRLISIVDVSAGITRRVSAG
eukprot:SAG31_NODE_5030_length_2793_cov_1.858575_1_plen_33_part_10